jgi:hypothetical protein
MQKVPPTDEYYNGHAHRANQEFTFRRVIGSLDQMTDKQRHDQEYAINDVISFHSLQRNHATSQTHLNSYKYTYIL